MKYANFYLIMLTFSSIKMDLVEIPFFEYQSEKSPVLSNIVLGVSFFDCVKECLNSRKCRSVNYKQPFNLCELSLYNSNRNVPGEHERKGYVTTNMNKWKEEVRDCDPALCERQEKCVQGDGLLTCQVTGCGLPPSRKGVLPDKEIIGLYSRTYYECDEGCVTTGNPISVCTEDRNWSDPDFDCKIQDCGIPVTENSKKVNFTTAEYRSNATVWCQDRYKSNDSSIDSAEVTCTANGSWSASSLNCEWGGCPLIEMMRLPACLTLETSSGNYIHDYAIYKANGSSGHSIGPHVYVECLSDQTWKYWVDVTCTTGLDCEEIQASFPASGAFTIEMNSQRTTLVYCDMDFMTGGWTIVQRREKGHISFKRKWNDYKNGFGNVNHDYWIGNDNIHEMTSSGTKHVVFLMEDKEGNERYIEYSIFNVGSESEDYILRIGGAIHNNGDAGDSLTGIADGQKFSTIDRDQDSAILNCAEVYNGGWWYQSCHYANPNGVWGIDSPEGIVWGSWKGIYYCMTRFVILIKN